MDRVLDTSPSRVRCLLGAGIDESPFSEESGPFFVFLRREFFRKVSKLKLEIYEENGHYLVTPLVIEIITNRT